MKGMVYMKDKYQLRSFPRNVIHGTWYSTLKVQQKNALLDSPYKVIEG
jgi:hypothetical protein